MIKNRYLQSTCFKQWYTFPDRTIWSIKILFLQMGNNLGWTGTTKKVFLWKLSFTFILNNKIMSNHFVICVTSITNLFHTFYISFVFFFTLLKNSCFMNILFQIITFGLILSKMPSWTRHWQCCTLSPPIPKFRQCNGSNRSCQTLVCVRKQIRESPMRTTSGSLSRASWRWYSCCEQYNVEG